MSEEDKVVKPARDKSSSFGNNAKTTVVGIGLGLATILGPGTTTSCNSDHSVDPQPHTVVIPPVGHHTPDADSARLAATEDSVEFGKVMRYLGSSRNLNAADFHKIKDFDAFIVRPGYFNITELPNLTTSVPNAVLQRNPFLLNSQDIDVSDLLSKLNAIRPSAFLQSKNGGDFHYENNPDLLTPDISQPRVLQLLESWVKSGVRHFEPTRLGANGLCLTASGLAAAIYPKNVTIPGDSAVSETNRAKALVNLGNDWISDILKEVRTAGGTDYIDDGLFNPVSGTLPIQTYAQNGGKNISLAISARSVNSDLSYFGNLGPSDPATGLPFQNLHYAFDVKNAQVNSAGAVAARTEIGAFFKARYANGRNIPNAKVSAVLHSDADLIAQPDIEGNADLLLHGNHARPAGNDSPPHAESPETVAPGTVVPGSVIHAFQARTLMDAQMSAPEPGNHR